MYDELVKRLRHSANFAEHGLTPPPSGLREAADVIEELSKFADTMRRLKCEGWYLQQSKFHDGYQAMSTMPLPDPPKEEP